VALVNQQSRQWQENRNLKTQQKEIEELKDQVSKLNQKIREVTQVDRNTIVCIWCEYIKTKSLPDKARLFFKVVGQSARSKKANLLYISLVIAVVFAGLTRDASYGGWSMVVMALLLTGWEKFKQLLKHDVSAKYEQAHNVVDLLDRLETVNNPFVKSAVKQALPQKNHIKSLAAGEPDMTLKGLEKKFPTNDFALTEILMGGIGSIVWGAGNIGVSILLFLLALGWILHTPVGFQLFEWIESKRNS